MRIAVRRFSLGPLAKFGCVLGTLLAFLPSLLCGLAGLALVRLIYRWLSGWQEMTVSLLGQELARVDLVHLLRLEGLLKALQVLTTASAPALFLAVLILALVGGVLLTVIITLAGLVYNWVAAATGGLIVEAAISGGEESPH
jgi:hypothetical protein